MDTPFITFVVFANSLDDFGLLRTVESIRFQSDVCWNLEIRLPDLPDKQSMEHFTHRNPRISIVTDHDETILISESSLVVAVIPSGVELLATACFEIRNAFQSPDIDVVVIRTMSTCDEAGFLGTSSIQLAPPISAIRRQQAPQSSHLMKTIPLPLCLLRDGILDRQLSLATQISESEKSQRIRREYLSELELKVQILDAQLLALLNRPNELEVMKTEFAVASERITLLEIELSAIRTSRTWRLGRAMLSPVRIVTRWRR